MRELYERLLKEEREQQAFSFDTLSDDLQVAIRKAGVPSPVIVKGFVALKAYLSA